ncbi:MAG TPA: hypothetical protein VGW76_11065, partial [Pyrinomonadaceae bacterium]|nr:hypothetical protein [Pyrinomonadaceae bacterium]
MMRSARMRLLPLKTGSRSSFAAARMAANLLSCILLALLFPSGPAAQQPPPSGWEWQNPLPQGNT